MTVPKLFVANLKTSFIQVSSNWCHENDKDVYPNLFFNVLSKQYEYSDPYYQTVINMAYGIQFVTVVNQLTSKQTTLTMEEMNHWQFSIVTWAGFLAEISDFISDISVQFFSRLAHPYSKPLLLVALLLWPLYLLITTDLCDKEAV